MLDADAQSPALPWLCGTRVQRVDGPFAGWFVLQLFKPGKKLFLLLACTTEIRGIGTTDRRPTGNAASSFVQRLRTQLEGTRLSSAQWWQTPATPSGNALALTLNFEGAGDRRARVVVDFDPQTPNLFLLHDNGTVLGAADERARRIRIPAHHGYYVPHPGRGIPCITLESALDAAGNALLTTKDQRHDDTARTRATTQTRTALKRAERKADAIRNDLARTTTTGLLRREAQLLLCHLGDIARGATTIRLRDDSVVPPEWLDLTLDPARNALQNAQHRFERARKLDRGIAIASARLSDTETQASKLRELLQRIETDPPDHWLDLAITLGVKLDLTTPPTRAAKLPPQRVCYRSFTSLDGHRILVGKGASDNDSLTLTIARPHDHWLHARGSAGAHVVIPLERKATLAQEVLLDAAHLAAHFSKLRAEPTVEIAHTERRFIRKSKGAAPGSVSMDRERVFILRLEPARLARLLASERN